MTSFSPELIERLQRYFSTRYNVDLSTEQADEHLNSLAKLYTWFADDRLG